MGAATAARLSGGLISLDWLEEPQLRLLQSNWGPQRDQFSWAKYHARRSNFGVFCKTSRNWGSSEVNIGGQGIARHCPHIAVFSFASRICGAFNFFQPTTAAPLTNQGISIFLTDEPQLRLPWWKLSILSMRNHLYPIKLLGSPILRIQTQIITILPFSLLLNELFSPRKHRFCGKTLPFFSCLLTRCDKVPWIDRFLGWLMKRKRCRIFKIFKKKLGK